MQGQIHVCTCMYIGEMARSAYSQGNNTSQSMNCLQADLGCFCTLPPPSCLIMLLIMQLELVPHIILYFGNFITYSKHLYKKFFVALPLSALLAYSSLEMLRYKGPSLGSILFNQFNHFFILLVTQKFNTDLDNANASHLST